jgi:hypothetical protein
MNICPHCQRLMIGGHCMTDGCEATIQEVPPPPQNTKTGRRTRRGRSSTPRDLTKPIPDKVNSNKYATGQGFTSLPNYLGYSRAQKKTDEIRQEKLTEIIAAGPFIPSSNNGNYLRSFGPPNSKERVEALIALFNHLKGGIWYVFKYPERHAKKLPAAQKLGRDIHWLEEQLQRYD